MIDSIPFILLMFCLVLRILPRMLWKEFNGTDSHFHFYYSELIKNNHHKIPQNEPRVIGGSNDCTYPFFYHWLLSFFPIKFIHFWDKFSGCIFDLLNGAVTIYLLSLVQPISVSEACLILSAYIIAPGLTFSFIGPRPYSLTPRNFSQFIFCIGCSFLIMSHFQSIGLNSSLLVLAAICFAILLLSSQFGTQVLGCIILAMVFDLRIGFAILLGLLLGMLFFRGFLVLQIKSQIEHLQWYFKYNYPFVQRKTNFHNLYAAIKQRNLAEVLREIVLHNQITTALLRHSTYFIALGLGFYALNQNHLNSIQKETLSIIAPLFLAFIVTNFGKARVFGEAERYIEFAYPLQMFLFLSLLPLIHYETVLYLLIAYNFAWYIGNLYCIRRQNASAYSYKALVNVLDKKPTTLICLTNNESYIFLRKTKAKIVGFLVNISLAGHYKDFFKKFFIRYPLVNPVNLSEICNQYDVTHILQNKLIKDEVTEQYKTIIAAISGFNLVYEDERYALYEKTS